MVKRYAPPPLGGAPSCVHAPDIAAMDLFIAPTIGFDLLYVLGTSAALHPAGPRRTSSPLSNLIFGTDTRYQNQ